MIKAFKGTSLVDFPDEIACVLFTGGCNLRCPHCYNKSLVEPEIHSQMEDIPVEAVVSEIERRKGFITGCVITGGEPTIHGKELINTLRKIRATEIKIKLDTNGMLPDVVKQCISENLVDYIALDVKASPEVYPQFGGSWENLEETLNAIRDSGINYEIRITAVPVFITPATLELIGERIKPVKTVAIQKFVGRNTLEPSFEEIAPYPPDEMKKLAEIMEKYAEKVLIR